MGWLGRRRESDLSFRFDFAEQSQRPKLEKEKDARRDTHFRLEPSVTESDSRGPICQKPAVSGSDSRAVRSQNRTALESLTFSLLQSMDQRAMAVRI